MAHNLSLKIASYNLHGLNQGSSLLEWLSGNKDMIFVQEHWLPPFSLARLDTACPGFMCFATSAMSDVISNRLLIGRPFGGVAIFVKENLAPEFEVIKLSSRYIILLAFSTLFINVYLPSSCTVDWENEYLDCLACIMNDICDLTYSNIVMGGDFNVDFTSNHPLINTLNTFMADMDLQNLDCKLPQNVTCSFRVDASGASSLIDHFMVTTSLCNSVNDVNMVDNGLNLSDHCALILHLLVPLQKSSTRNSNAN